MFRYAHTNIIARDLPRMVQFYKEVLHCQSINQTRDLRGEWLDKLTHIKDAHILGEHLLLPGYGDTSPTLEIFSYDTFKETTMGAINEPGIAHLAFEVDDLEATLTAILKAGGSTVGETVTAHYPNNMKATFVYARDPEGNILELQSWQQQETAR